MTVQEILANEKGNYTDYEIYEQIGNRNNFHTDNIRGIEYDSEVAEMEVRTYEIMSENEYDITVCANSCVSADFAEWYNDKNAKVLCILI